MVFYIPEAVLRKLASTDDTIYKAEWQWNRLKVRLLPSWFNKSGREFIKSHEHLCGKIRTILQRIHQLERKNGDEVYRYNLNPDGDGGSDNKPGPNQGVQSQPNPRPLPPSHRALCPRDEEA
ncbi:hypothetical protein BDV19DRAFT_385029 [Aspergillus venezuelensis]